MTVARFAGFWAAFVVLAAVSLGVVLERYVLSGPEIPPAPCRAQAPVMEAYRPVILDHEPAEVCLSREALEAWCKENTEETTP